MTETVFFALKLVIHSNAPAPLYIQQEKNELFLSANVRLCGLNKVAHLETAELAEKFRDATLPRLRKRYGNDVDVDICKWTQRGNLNRTLERIQKDSELVRKRLAVGNMAPNQTP